MAISSNSRPPLPGQTSFLDGVPAEQPAPAEKRRKRPSLVASLKFRSLLKTHGGKNYLARRIIDLFPEHNIYTEPFAGGLNVLLNKLRAPIEVVGDINLDIANFWKVVRDLGDELSTWIRDLPYTDDVFQRAKDAMSDPEWSDGVYRAVNFMVWNRFSRGGLGKDFAWSKRLRGGRPGDENAWLTIKAKIPLVVERLRGVEIRCHEAMDVIREFDSSHTLHYCDPPYLHETRTARSIYTHEMGRDDHVRLLVTLLGCRGTVVLSGYSNPLYDEVLQGWRRIAFSMPNHSGQGKSKQRREEIIWINH
jgi:DNA adenine methylase